MLSPRKKTALISTVVVLLLTTSAFAQEDSDAIRREHWVTGVFVGGGNGLSDRTNVHFVRAGVSVGRVMTGELGHGWRRGTFEFGMEVKPVDYVLWDGYKNVYGFGFNPVVMKWNFTSGHKVVPFFLAQGGYLRTVDNVPPGDTSKNNFTSGAGVGMHYFVKPGQSLSWDVRATHLSNASIGNHNPGVNASLQFQLTYNWWHTK